MNLSPSTYYYKKKEKADETELVKKMESIIELFPGSGYRTVTKLLKKEGIKINHKRVSRIMRENKLQTRKVIKFKEKTTNSKHNLKKYSNKLKEEKHINSLNKAIVGDITQYSVNGKDYFLAVLMDLCNREIVGKAISDKNDTELVITCLKDVIENRGKNNLKGCIHHTDSDVRYCSKKYIEMLKEVGFKISMCKGNAYENAHAESLFKTIKYQEINISDYDDKLNSANSIFEYINRYNTERPHSSLGYLSPVEYGNNLLNEEKKSKKG